MKHNLNIMKFKIKTLDKIIKLLETIKKGANR